MNTILLGQSYYLRFDPKLRQAMQPYPPLGTLYAASYLRSHGYSVALFDAMLASDESQWAQRLDETQPDFAVLFEDNFNYLSKMCLLRMRQAAFSMMASARQRGCTVIAGGADASDHVQAYLEHGAHFVLRGEGEQTLVELMDVLTGQSHQELSAIRGLTYPGENGRPIVTAPRPDLQDLDSLPFPAYDLIDLERYRAIWTQRHGYFSMSMVTTRGCPYHCNWCAKPIWGQRYHLRSPANVVAELRWLQENYHPDHIWFMDDILGLKPGWLEQFADLLESQGLHIPFKSLNRVDLLLREGTIPALQRAGAQIVWVGAESGSQKILDAMQKGTRREQIYAAARQLHAAGIQVGFYLQFGYPGETLEDIRQTLQMVRDCRPDDIGISVSYPLPGTPLYQAVRQQMGAKQNWVDSEDLDMLYDGPYGTAFYRQLHQRVHLEFRLRRAWSDLAGLWRQPHRIRLASLRRLLAMCSYAIRLPISQLKLAYLAKTTRPELAPLRPALDPAAAARPTPQSGPASRQPRRPVD